MKLLTGLLVIVSFSAHIESSVPTNHRHRSMSDEELIVLRKTVVCCLIGCSHIEKYHETFKDTCNALRESSKSHSVLCCCWSSRKN